MTSPKWLFGHVLALALVALFINNGFWQLDRLEHRRERNAAQAAMAALPRIPVAEALAAAAGAGPLSVGEVPEFRAVSASGTYLPGAEVLLRGRSLGGQPGFYVLTPLALDAESGDLEGLLLLVERGWVPFAQDSVPVAIAAPPTGSVVIEGRLRAPTSPPDDFTAALAPRDPPEGTLVQSYYVDVERLAGQMPGPLVPAYVELGAQLPPQSGDYPVIAPQQAPTEGSHLGYAIQWFAFAVVGIVGYALLLRSVRRSGSGRSGPAPTRSTAA